MHSWLNYLERKLYRFRIPPLMKYIVFAMGGVFVLDYLLAMTTAYSSRLNLIDYLSLNIALVM